MRVDEWLYRERLGGYPSLLPGDVAQIFTDSTVGRLIGKFQGRPGRDQHELWSHDALYVGGGKLAEATTPRGGVVPIETYCSRRHRMEVWRNVDWTPGASVRICAVAETLAGHQYDYLNIARHLIDNLVERLTYSGRRGHGFRPLARLLGDRDGYGQNVCSELLGWARNLGTSPGLAREYPKPRDLTDRILRGDRIPEQPDGERWRGVPQVGQERPLDLSREFDRGSPWVRVWAHNRGVVTT